MGIIKVFHGSDHIIKSPMYLGGKEDNDYGNGFYVTEFEDRAKSWAALNGNPQNAIVNEYELDLQGIQVLDLNDYGVLAWIAEVVSHRGTTQEAASILGNRLVQKYKLNTDGYDVIKGYRADDSYTQVIETFLQNQINIAEVERMFYKGSLGNQIFLKSERAFSKVQWKKSYEIEMKDAYKEEDSAARRSVGHFLQKRMEAILLEGYTVPGITAGYAVQNQLAYDKKGGYYEQCGI